MDSRSADSLFPLVYDELRQLAVRRVASDAAARSMNATALVHEAFLKLAKGDREPRFNDREHLFATAAEVMRRILIDRARWRKSGKHGGDVQRVELMESQIVAPASDEAMLLVNEALEKLEQSDPICADLVKMRFFSGFSLQEIADATGVSYATVKRRWSYAKAWLTREIGDPPSGLVDG